MSVVRPAADPDARFSADAATAADAIGAAKGKIPRARTRTARMRRMGGL